MAATVRSITPEIMIEDVESTIRFYREFLGFEVEIAVPETGTPVWAQIKNGESRLMFYRRSEFTGELPIWKDKPLCATIEILIKVDNIDEIYERIRDKVKIVTAMHATDYGTKEMVIENNNGYLIGLSG